MKKLNIKSYFLGAVLIAMSLLLFFFPQQENNKEGPYVNVYNWYGMMPTDILKDFEKETGIHVRYDLYDNNEILEAKLLASNSGYDVVFPSLVPYAARQIEAGVYQEINKNLIPNLTSLNLDIISNVKKIDPELTYVIPFYWGTLGFIVNVEKVLKRIPNAPLDSYDLLYNPTFLKELKDCGITYLEEAVDVFPQILAYLGLDPESESLEDLQQAQQHLFKVRPFISRFSSSRFVNELIMGESCLAQAWSGEAQMAQDQAAGKEMTLQYIIPKEGTTLWVDVIAIPKGAPHPQNAHKFINFILRDDISARISNFSQLPTTNTRSWTLIDPQLKAKKEIFLPLKKIKTLRLDKPPSLDYDRARNRAWTQVRLNLSRD
ncbi:MAG: extracellular solute-binding protein [Proteobacteria bacterium]|nr:extracellular solute-binding protein [Pseudomonadota bacterium]